MLRPNFGIPCASLLGLLVPLLLPRGADAAEPQIAKSFAMPKMLASYTQSTPRNLVEASPSEPSPEANVVSIRPPKDRAAPAELSGAYAQNGKLHGGLFGGVGFPRPFAIEGYIAQDRFMAGVEYSGLPATSFGDIRVSMGSVSVEGRYFPFKGPFFFGLRAGVQHARATASVTVAGYGTQSGSIEADSKFLNPRIGLMWTWSSNLAIALEAGVQIPIAPTSTTSLPAGVTDDGRGAAVVAPLAKNIVPSVDLLRVGFVL